MNVSDSERSHLREGFDMLHWANEVLRVYSRSFAKVGIRRTLTKEFLERYNP